MNAIRIELDGAARELPAGTTLADFVRERGYAEGTVATAVNGEFVPRDRRAKTFLRDGDAVAMFRQIVGG